MFGDRVEVALSEVDPETILEKRVSDPDQPQPFTNNKKPLLTLPTTTESVHQRSKFFTSLFVNDGKIFSYSPNSKLQMPNLAHIDGSFTM